jgi:hypothetical protein
MIGTVGENDGIGTEEEYVSRPFRTSSGEGILNFADVAE